MFGREIRTNIPELRRDKFVLNEKIRDRDWRNKVSQKVYADAKCGAKENDIVPGDQVLLENTMSHTLWKPRRATSSLYSPSTDEIVLL